MIRTNKDITCLAEGYTFPVDQKCTGINENQIIVGPTRSGKTVSVVESRLLHTFDENIIVNLTKRTLVERYIPIFQKRGYEVLDLNFADPCKSNISYDPMTYVTNDKEALKLAETMVMNSGGKSQDVSGDPYWNQAAISSLAAIIGLARLNAMSENRTATFGDFLKLYENLEVSQDVSGNSTETSLDFLFDAAGKKYPGNQACRLWKTFRGTAAKTSSCIFSIMNSAVDKIMTQETLDMMKNGERLSFKKFADKKTILFITTSPVNKAMQKMTTLFFSDAFRILFEYAESLPTKELPIPTHLICDDFATGSIIPDFDEYLSVFCAKRISVSLLLQSESQLQDMYGKGAATTIINNCDTYLYFGGMDNETCTNISRKSNLPVDEVYYMPLEQVMFFRRGARPVMAKRYQTYRDPLFSELFNKETDNII